MSWGSYNMSDKNIQVTLASRPVGWAKETDFKIVETEIPKPVAGQVLVKNLYLSLDPYMRGRMNDMQSYAPNVKIGQVMVGGTAGEVVESNNPKFKAGDSVVGYFGWQQYGVSDGAGLQKVDPKLARFGEERAPTAPSADSEAMLIKNPFDRTEAFEFPTGTSKAEAREAVAKLLMERAHDRLPLLAEASRRRGATAKHGTRESSQLQDSQYRNSQVVLGRGPG